MVELPGASGDIDFDDIVYSVRLQRVLVPARGSGLYLIEPDKATAERVPVEGDIASADAGGGLLFLADRGARTIRVVDPGDGSVIASAGTAAAPDYVRYVETTGELWVSEPGASPPGIEIFSVPEGADAVLQRVTSIPVPGGAEGLTISTQRKQAYTHAGDDLVAIGLADRAVTARWATGCNGTHGFPRLDEVLGVVLASCADDGAVTLLSLDDGRQIARHELGGGESLPAYSSRSARFYVRSDPGTTITSLQPSSDGLARLGEVTTPKAGHCLGADDRGHIWTCDAARGRILRYDDPAPS